ncbi:MAG TPA: cbb3-type cytochrome c oxidase subunit 3 [Noviherbaspirillum sp.]|nr:cbb3-type cytochrome c oxidase subunit 3 [Noviherbaspirillum sp.]
MSIESLIFDARNIVTVLSFASFLGIVFWAYSASRKPAFEEAANLPFADEPNSRGEEQHG